MTTKNKSMSEYNTQLKCQSITLREFIKRFNDESPTFVKIDDQLIHFTKIEEEYLDKIVGGFQLIPNGGVIYLK